MNAHLTNFFASVLAMLLMGLGGTLVVTGAAIMLKALRL